MRAAAGAAARAPGAPGAADAAKGPARLLILDEDRVEGGMLAFHLRREGLVVMLMTSPDEAVDAMAWAAPDVLLVELTGRGFDGPAFLRNLGEQSIDVFAVVDRPLDAEVELEALRCGVVEILTKPLDAQALARRLQARPQRQRRGSLPGLPDGQVSGDLAVHSAMYILQLCHRHRLNARLHVEIDGDWGVLLVRHGEVIDAEAPSAAGREAAYQAIRANQGAFVLVPLGPDAEELSRDDVVRADLATLVGDALGRREARPVNAQRVREADTFVLPHVGSPRGPMARKHGGDETLEYQGRADDRPGRPETARVKRPGETDRARRAEASDDPRKATTGEAPRPRSPTRPMPVAPEGADVRVEVRGQATGTGATGRVEPSPRVPTGVGPIVAEPLREDVSAARAAAQARETLDDGFDEPTDQEARRQSGRTGPAEVRPSSKLLPLVAPGTGAAGATPSAGGMGSSGSAPVSRPISRPVSRTGLRRMAGSRGAAGKDEQGFEPTTTPPVRRIQAPTDRMKAKTPPPTLAAARLPRLDGLVIALAIAAFALAVFVVWRVIANGVGPATSELPELPKDPEVRYGAALVELGAGRDEQALAALEAVAAENPVPDGALASLARLYYRTGRLMEAESVLTRLASSGAGGAHTWAWLGLVRAERQDHEGARGAFAKARAERPTAALDQRLEKLERAP